MDIPDSYKEKADALGRDFQVIGEEALKDLRAEILNDGGELNLPPEAVQDVQQSLARIAGLFYDKAVGRVPRADEPHAEALIALNKATVANYLAGLAKSKEDRVVEIVRDALYRIGSMLFRAATGIGLA